MQFHLKCVRDDFFAHTPITPVGDRRGPRIRSQRNHTNSLSEERAKKEAKHKVLEEADWSKFREVTEEIFDQEAIPASPHW